MTVDARARQFLGDGPQRRLEAQKSVSASDRILAYRNQEYISKVGAIAEQFLGFMLEQRQRKDWLDDEVIGGIALFTINVRESFGTPQHETDDARWSAEYRAEQLAMFDEICEEVQRHFERNKNRERSDGWIIE